MVGRQNDIFWDSFCAQVKCWNGIIKIQLNTSNRKIEMQQTHRMKIFSKFTESIKHLVSKATMEQFHERYYIREFKIWEIDSTLSINLYLGIVTRTKKGLLQKNQYRWLQNQLRLFVWSLVFYTLSKNIDIHQMSQQDWEFFASIFPNKQKILFQYQATSLLKNHNQYKKWTHEQDQLFEELVKKDNFRLRWSQLGKALYIQSNKKYFRTSKQCRERWLNHLDPSKLKKYWLETEDFILIEYVKYFGKKWAIISKKLQNKRNEHSIKNRFKSLLTKESKICLEPYNQNQLVDSIYYKLLKNVSKDKLPQENMAPKIERKQPEEIYEEEHEEVYHFSSNQELSGHKELDPIYDYEQEQSISIGRRDKDILGDLSLNSVSKQPEVRQTKVNFSEEKDVPSQIFEFTKLNYDVNERKNEEKEKEGSQEMQKRIRADLFLQEDPFELLKSHFYRESQ